MNSDKTYISTRLIKKSSKIAFEEGAKKAMEAVGYVLVAENGWLVKKFSNGSVQQIKQLETIIARENVKLD